MEGLEPSIVMYFPRTIPWHLHLLRRVFTHDRVHCFSPHSNFKLNGGPEDERPSCLAQLQSIFIHMLRSISDAYAIQMLNLHIRYLLMNYEKNWIGWSIFSLPLWLSQASYQDFLLADCCLTDMFQSSSESIVIVLICSFSFFKDATVICMQVPYKNLPIDTYTGPLSWLQLLESNQPKTPYESAA